MGHEIAMQIKIAADKKQKLAMILPVGPMGMYRWASLFLNEWDVNCDHVYTFNMNEWADSDGNTLCDVVKTIDCYPEMGILTDIKTV